MSYASTISAESSLVGYWKLDESSGTSAADSKGSNTGTYVNSPTLSQGSSVIDGTSSVLFARASSQYVEMSDAANLKGNSALTLEAWIKLTSTPASGELYTIVGKGSSFYFTLINDTGTLKLNCNPSFGSGSGPARVAWTPSTGVWYHVAATWDGSNVRFYVNGAAQGTAQAHSFTAAAGDTTKPRIADFASTHYMNGAIDEVAIYNAALSEGSISAHYTAGTAATGSDSGTATEGSGSVLVTTPVSASDSGTATDSAATQVAVPGAGGYAAAVVASSPLVYLKLNEASGTSAADAVGSYTGTYTGSPILGAASLVSTDSVGRAVQFTAASSQYITLGNQSAFGDLTAITVEMMVNFTTLPSSGNQYALAGKNGSWYLTLFNNAGTYQLNGQGNFVDAPQRVNWTPNTGVNYHLVMTWSAATGTKFYVNGSQQGSTVTASSAPAAQTSAAVEFGRFNSTLYLDGTLDEIAVYNSVLSAATVTAHYAATTTASGTDSSAATDSASLTTFDATRYVGSTMTGTIKVLAVGDSNTSGGYSGIAWSVWPTRVQTALAAALPSNTITLTNNAVGGTTSYDLLTAYATAIGDEQPSVVVLMHGTNDAWYDDPLGGYPRGDGADYSASAYETRLGTLIDSALGLTDAAGRSTKVVLCTPPPAAVQADGTTLWRDSVRLSALREKVRSVAAAKRVRYVDPWGAIQAADPTGWKTTYLNDGVHLKSAGQQIVADLVYGAVYSLVSSPVEEDAYATDTAAVTVGTGSTTALISASDTGAASEATPTVASLLLAVTASDIAYATETTQYTPPSQDTPSAVAVERRLRATRRRRRGGEW